MASEASQYLPPAFIGSSHRFSTLKTERFTLLGKGTQPMAGSGSDGLATLNRRYARGEIDREEYERRRRDLAGLA